MVPLRGSTPKRESSRMMKLWLGLALLLAACGSPGPTAVCSGDCMVYRGEPFTYGADQPLGERDERFF
jgi:hypothetical protein